MNLSLVSVTVRGRRRWHSPMRECNASLNLKRKPDREFSDLGNSRIRLDLESMIRVAIQPSLTSNNCFIGLVVSQ